jgi:hypothetical protein
LKFFVNEEKKNIAKRELQEKKEVAEAENVA